MSEHDDPEHEDNNTDIHARNARYGLILFFIYLLLYGGFVGISAFSRDTLKETYLGVNLALWYGMGLIVAALALAGVYMQLCRANKS
jgi:uncharacterized membrane protein (DUF485 family)